MIKASIKFIPVLDGDHDSFKVIRVFNDNNNNKITSSFLQISAVLDSERRFNFLSLIVTSFFSFFFFLSFSWGCGVGGSLRLFACVCVCVCVSASPPPPPPPPPPPFFILFIFFIFFIFSSFSLVKTRQNQDVEEIIR